MSSAAQDGSLGPIPQDGLEIAVRLPADLAGALAAIGEALDFPECYGHNLDALLDCLRDLAEPVVLRLVGWQELAWHDPSGWARLRETLGHRIAEGGHSADPRFAPAPGFGIRRG